MRGTSLGGLAGARRVELATVRDEYGGNGLDRGTDSARVFGVELGAAGLGDGPC